MGQALRAETTFPLAAVPYSVFSCCFGHSLGPSLRELHGADRVQLALGAWPLLAACALPLLVGWARGVPGVWRGRAWLLIMILVPVLVLALLVWRNFKPWNARYLAVIMPWLLIWAAAGLARMPRWPGVLLTGLLVGLTLWSVGNHFLNERYAKADLRVTARTVERLNAAGDPVLVPVVTDVFDYYYSGGGRLIHSFNLPPLGNADEAEAFCAEVLAGNDRCLYVQAREWFFDPRGFLPPALARLGDLELVERHPGVEVYLWTRGLAKVNDGD